MYFEDIKLDYEIPIKPVEIKKDQLLDFARLYDNIPLHIDEEYASKTPFKKIIAPGVMSFMCVWAEYLKVDIFGEELLAGKSTKIEWFKPVFAGDVLSAKAVVSKLTDRNAKNGIVELTIYAYNQNGDLVLSDVAEAFVKKKIR